MNTPDTTFTIELNGVVMTITQIPFKGREAYKITFSSSRETLVIVKAKSFDYGHFWTSVPEGRQREAEGVGALIEEYINKKR